MRSANFTNAGARRNAYSPPTLLEFGPVGKLSQAGTGTMSEAAGMGMNMSVNRRA